MHHVQHAIPKTLTQFIKHFFKPYRIYFFTSILIDIFCALYITLQPYIIKIFINTTIEFLGKKELLQAVYLPISMLIGLSICNHVAWRLSNYMHIKRDPLEADIISEYSNYAYEHSMNFFQNNLSGTVGNKIISIANDTEYLISESKSLFRNFLTLFSAIIISCSTNYIFSIVFLIAFIVFVTTSFYISRTTETLAKSYAESKSLSAGIVVDSFININNVILFAKAAYEKLFLKSSLNNMVINHQILDRKFMIYASLFAIISVSFEFTIITLLIYLGTKKLITAGDFVLIFMLASSVLNHIWIFAESFFRITEKLGSFKQALESISTPHEILDQPNATPLQITTGTIVFSRVKFFYNENQQLFEDKTLVINGGEKIGLVGYSGSGKSTFVNLIIRAFDIQSGDILIDNQSIRSITLQSLRENIAFIPQDPLLFHRTIMDNIKYGKQDANDDEVLEIAKLAHVHEFITQLPQGYQTLVGERGVKLSNGQRQRIAIARAMLKNSKILILDEATSALDSITEQLIQEALKVAMKNKTVIVIAHRLSTIKAMDRILVFNKGRIMEEGAHEYLLAKGSIYQTMWQVQQSFL